MWCPLGEALLDEGFVAGEVRLQNVVSFLAEQELTCLEDFSGASRFLSTFIVECMFPSGIPRIATITGSEQLPEEDVQFLQCLADRAPNPVPCNVRSRSSRQASAAPRVEPYPCIQPEDMVRMTGIAKMQIAGVGNYGPRHAARLVQEACIEQSTADWAEKARVISLLGSCPNSHDSFISGYRCWMSFAGSVLKLRGSEMPPTLEGVLAWSTLFRSPKTFQNYVGYVRLACQLARVSTSALDDRAVARATLSIAKRRNFVPRPKLFVKLCVVQRMLPECGKPNSPWSLADGMLFLTAYIFLLRVPSECLPIVKIDQAPHPGLVLGQSTLWVEHDKVVLKLLKRKNKPEGSVLWRSCWCSTCKATCPVHVLGAYFKSLACGSAPFRGKTPSGALGSLRDILGFLKVPDAALFRTHDLRRGHAEDLKLSGANLFQILKAGEWRSPAFLSYLDVNELESAAVVEAHLEEESDDDDT